MSSLLQRPLHLLLPLGQLGLQVLHLLPLLIQLVTQVRQLCLQAPADLLLLLSGLGERRRCKGSLGVAKVMYVKDEMVF